MKELNIGLQYAAQQLTEIDSYVKCRNEKKTWQINQKFRETCWGL